MGGPGRAAVERRGASAPGPAGAAGPAGGRAAGQTSRPAPPRALLAQPPLQHREPRPRHERLLHRDRPSHRRARQRRPRAGGDPAPGWRSRPQGRRRARLPLLRAHARAAPPDRRGVRPAGVGRRAAAGRSPARLQPHVRPAQPGGRRAHRAGGSAHVRRAADQGWAPADLRAGGRHLSPGRGAGSHLPRHGPAAHAHPPHGARLLRAGLSADSQERR